MLKYLTIRLYTILSISLFIQTLSFPAYSFDVTNLQPDKGQGPYVSAHRGGPAVGLPENTLAAIKDAYSKGVRLYEIDVRITSDGKIVLFHDRRLNRLMGVDKVFRSTPYSELQQYKLRDFTGAETSHTIELFDNLLSWLKANDAVVQIDLKNLSAFEPVVKRVEDAAVTDKVIFIAYKLETAIMMQKTAPWVWVSNSFYTVDMLNEGIEAGLDMGRTVAWMGLKGVDTNLTAALKAKNLLAVIGALGFDETSHDARYKAASTPCAYNALIAKGADIVATDFPRKVRAVFDGKIACP